MTRILTGPFAEIEIPSVALTPFVLRHASRLADRPALVDGMTGRTLTYGELEQSVARMTGGLRERGFGKGDMLALMAPNLPEYAAVLLATARTGGTVTTINPAYVEREIAHQLADSRPRFVVTIPELQDRITAGLPDSCEDVFLLDPETGACSLDGAPDLEQTRIDPAEDVVALPYSSGTTGLPKGVMLTHRNLVANLLQLAPLEQREGDAVVSVLPMFHIYGMQLLMNLPLSVGATVYTLPRFDLETFLRLNQEHRARHAYVVPPIALALARHPCVDGYDLSSLEKVFSAAAPLGAELAVEVEQRLGCPVAQGYGLTEASPASHMQPPGGSPTGSVGAVVANTECRLVDPVTGEDAEPDANGEIWIRGPQIMKGYFNAEEATREAIDTDGWLHTGDIANVNEQGNFFIVDRMKELIKYKGFQVAPAELEALLLTHPAVADVAVIPIPDDEAGELPKAFVVAQAEVDDETLMRFVAAQVATYKQVRVIEFVDAIPKSPSGKILRRELREREARA